MDKQTAIKQKMETKLKKKAEFGSPEPRRESSK
jgi:hypothetical protein